MLHFVCKCVGRWRCKSTSFTHRDKTRVKMPAKIFPRLNVKCYLFMGPTLGFDTEQRNSFWSNLFFLTIQTRFWQYYSQLIMTNSLLNDEFLVLLGPIIRRLFTCSNAEKNKIKKQRVLALVLSLWFYLTYGGWIRIPLAFISWSHPVS